MIVFLHGWLMSPDIWAHACAAVEARHRCVALCQPAHGDEPAPSAPWAMRDWVDWLFMRIGDDAERLVLVGHSMGGMLALAGAVARPERVAGVVSVSSTERAWSEAEQNAWLAMVKDVRARWSPQLAAQLAPFLVGEGHLARNPSWRHQWFARVERYDREGMLRLASAVASRPDLTEAVRSLTVPLLVVHGDADVAVPPHEGCRLAALASGEIEILDGVGHCPPLEAPEAFAQRLSAFVSRQLS